VGQPNGENRLREYLSATDRIAAKSIEEYVRRVLFKIVEDDKSSK